MSANSPFLQALKTHEEAVRQSFNEEGEKTLAKIAEVITQALRDGKKILLCGNGGSAADAQHIAAEFVGRYKKERPGLGAIALTTDTSALTAIGNDYGFDVVFSRQIEAFGSKGDVLIALSTSGNSKNILRAVEEAKKKGLLTIGFTGGTGGELAKRSDITFISRSNDTPRIQEVHGLALHAVCEVVENNLVR